MNRAPSKRLASPVVAGVLIFIVGLGARALWAMTLKNDLYWADERAFTEIARHLARNEGYISESYRANPVFPAMIFTRRSEEAGAIGRAL